MNDLNITIANEYFEKLGLTVDWDDTLNVISPKNDTVTLMEHYYVESIIALEVAIHLARTGYVNGCGVDGSIVDSLSQLRGEKILDYQKSFQKKYSKFNTI